MRTLFLLTLLAADPGGWSHARWGMSESQVIDAFAGQAVRLESPIPTCTLVRDGRKIPAPIAVPEVPIGPTTWRACLYFDGAGALESVRLTPIDDNSQAEFQRVETRLVEKYGRPFHRRSDAAILSQWTRGDTRITLRLATIRAVRVQFLSLLYERTGEPDPNLD